MNFILSLFLCLAMVLSGTSELPAEPTAQTTWTLSDVELTVGDRSVNLEPEARITGAADAGEVTLHFEVSDGEKGSLPLSLGVSDEELRFSFGSGMNAYSLSAEEFARLTELDAENAATLEIAGALIESYGAFLAVLRDSERVQAYNDTVEQLLYDSCGGEPETLEVEVDGETLQGERVTLELNPENVVALADALRESGIPELENMLNTALRIGNLDAGTQYASFSEVLAGESSDTGDAFGFPLTITTAEREDLHYTKAEADIVQGNMGISLYEEVTERAGDADLAMQLSMRGEDAAHIDLDLSAQYTGTFTAPSAMHMDLSLDALVPDSEENLAEDAGEAGSEEIHLVGSLDRSVNDDGMSNGSLRITSADNAIDLGWVGSLEADGARCYDVNAALSADDDPQVGLRFTFLCGESTYVDPFLGTQDIAVTEEALENEESDLMARLMVDLSQMSADFTELMQQPEVQELADLLENGATTSETAVVGVIGGADGPTSVIIDEPDSEMSVTITDSDGVSDAIGGEEAAPAEPAGSGEAAEDYAEEGDESVQVSSLAEADEIFAGDLPAYEAPSDYILTHIEASPEVVDLFYEKEDGSGFSLTAYPDTEYAHYLYADGELVSSQDPEVTLYPDAYGAIESIEVDMADGVTLWFNFGDDISRDAVSEYLDGLE